MKYSEILDKLQEIKGVGYAQIEIANCVSCSLGLRYSITNEEEFDIICEFTYYVWDKIDKGYTQLLTDIIVDLYKNEGFGYRDEEEFKTYRGYDEEPIELSRTLTLEQMKGQDSRVAQMVMDIFYERYYD